MEEQNQKNERLGGRNTRPSGIPSSWWRVGKFIPGRGRSENFGLEDVLGWWGPKMGE
jgi:hypothetical protein